jgi:hypothetical protein
MQKSIAVTVPHDLGAAEAKRRIAEQLDQARHSYVDTFVASAVTWTEDHADLQIATLGQTVTGGIDIAPDTVRIEVQLPWPLSMLAGGIEGLIKSRSEDILQLEHMPKK